MTGRPRERFCKRGHDTEALGRDANYACKECRREYDRRRAPEKRAREASKRDRRSKHQAYSYSDEWTRARVKRWLEIAAEDPITAEHNGTLARKKAFETRYKRLEAAVPTPDDEAASHVG